MDALEVMKFMRQLPGKYHRMDLSGARKKVPLAPSERPPFLSIFEFFHRIQILLWGQWNMLLSHFPNMLALSRVTMTSWGNAVLLSTIMLYFKCQHILMCRWPKEWVNILPLRITELIFKQKRKRRRRGGRKRERLLDVLRLEKTLVAHLIQSSI